MRTFVSTCVLAALVCGLSMPAAAYTFDHRTLFTFNQPITLPGVTLPAGTYTFRLADPTTGGKVVQVLNDSGTRSYAMLMSIPAYRQDVARASELSFMETGAGRPAAIRTWWQEGSRLGYEFVYPKEQADRLARSVMPTPGLAEARPSAPGDANIAAESPAPVDVAEPTVEERADATSSTQFAEQQGQPAQPAPVFAQEPTPPAEPGAREQLPQTASFIPLTVALGTLMLIGGAWLRRKA